MDNFRVYMDPEFQEVSLLPGRHSERAWFMVAGTVGRRAAVVDQKAERARQELR